MTTEEIKYCPFSNGSEYEFWSDRNCDRCQHHTDNASGCKGEEGLLFALFDDGTISMEICDFIGTTERSTQDNGYSFCDLNRVCNHFQPK